MRQSEAVVRRLAVAVPAQRVWPELGLWRVKVLT